MRVLPALLGIVFAALTATPALAYVGPGAGVGALGAVVGVVGAVFMSVFVIVLWPIRKLLRRRRDGAEPSADTDA